MKALMFMTAMHIAERAVRVMQWLGRDTDHAEFHKELPNGTLDFSVGTNFHFPDSCTYCNYDLHRCPGCGAGSDHRGVKKPDLDHGPGCPMNDFEMETV